MPPVTLTISPAITPEIPALEALLAPWRDTIGADFIAYRNHLYRVLHFYRGLRGGEELPGPVLAAAVFHDLGIWTDHTVDYLEPSARLAQTWMEREGRQDWAGQLLPMVREHHKLSSYQGDAVVEAFRRADWADVSLGLLRFGLPRTYVAQVRAAFPNAGFHKRLVQLTMGQLRKRPWNPLPMLKF